MSPLVILLAATLGGAALTYLFDDDAPLLARLAMGAPLGMTILGLVGFALASSLGALTGPAVGLAALCAGAPVSLLLLRKDVRARAGTDLAALLASANRLPKDARAAGLVALFVAAVFFTVRLYDRAFFYAPDGGLHTGLDHNLGDLPYHLAIITSFLDGANFPPEHPELAGARLTYPFLVDFVTAQLVQAGSSLRDAYLAQSVVLATAFLAVLFRFGKLLGGSRGAAVFTVGLVALSGGLGWWRLFDEVDPSAGGLVGHLQRLSHDHTIRSTGELRWGNLFLCMLIPQRSLLLGMPLFLVVATQWWRALGEGALERRRLLGAGAVAGLLPLAHAHSFALAIALGAALFVLFRRWREGLWFLGAALVLAAPQVAWLSLGSEVKAASFVAVDLWWDNGEQEPLSFWWWNLGLFLPLYLLAVAWRGKNPVAPARLLLFQIPFLLCFVVPNLLRLSPWIWDNIKFLVYWHLAAAVLVARLLVRLWASGGSARVLAASLTGALTFSGALDLWRVASRSIDHTLYDPASTAFARSLLEVTSPRAVVLHATIFNSEVYLTGRRSVLGYPGHMWSQGLDSGTREADIKAIYEGDPRGPELLRRYEVDYVLLGPRERELGALDEAFAGYPVVAESGERLLYSVPR